MYSFCEMKLSFVINPKNGIIEIKLVSSKIDEKIIQSLFGIKEHSVKWEEILSDQGVPTGGKVTIDVAGLHRNIQTIMDALDISDIPKTKETKRVLFSWLNETLKQVPDAKKVEFQIDSSTYEFTAY